MHASVINLGSIIHNIFLQGGYQPLHLAATNNHIDVIEYLVNECDAPVEPEAMVYCSTKQCSWKKHKIYTAHVINFANAVI